MSEENEEMQEPTSEDVAEMQDATKLPMTICVTGAPGSGKSAVAERIGEEYGARVVDGVADRFKEEMGLALGVFGSYATNLMVALNREQEDHKARVPSDKPVVVVGSLVESLAYVGLKAEYYGQQIASPIQQASLHREMAAMQVLGVLLQDTMKFQYYFFTKLPTEIHIPGQDPKFDNYTRSLETAITHISEQVGAKFYELTGTTDQMMEQVRKVLGDPE